MSLDNNKSYNQVAVTYFAGQNLQNQPKVRVNVNPFKPGDAKWLHFKAFKAILVKSHYF